MTVTLTLPHYIDLEHHQGWLWYSHEDVGKGPTDRLVVSNIQDPNLPRTHFANNYFMSDRALTILAGTDYNMTYVGGYLWDLEFEDTGIAALFKLTFG